MTMTRRALFGLPLALPAVVIGGGAAASVTLANKTSATVRIERAWSRVDIILEEVEQKLARRLARGNFSRLRTGLMGEAGPEAAFPLRRDTRGGGQ